jgi:hypothetical protein
MRRSASTYRLTLLTLVGAGILLLAPIPALSAGSLDQSQTSQTTPDSGSLVNSSYWEAQTFTAGVSGRLDQVDLLLRPDLTDPP